MAGKERFSRREFLSLTSISVASAALTACGGQPTPQTAAQPAGTTGSVPAVAPIEIRYRYPYAETNNLGATQRKLLEKHSYTVPGANVKVNLELGIEDERTFADIAAGTASDVFWTDYNEAVVKGIHQGIFANAEDLMRAANFDFSDFVDGLQEVYIFEGKMWGIPYEQVVVLWAYNPKVFAEAEVEPPSKDWTWDDVIDVGLKLTRDTAGKRPTDPGFNLNEVAVWRLQPWQLFVIQEYLPYTAGGAYVDESGTTSTITTPAFVETLQWLRDIYQKHHIATLSPQERGIVTNAVGFRKQATGRSSTLPRRSATSAVCTPPSIPRSALKPHPGLTRSSGFCTPRTPRASMPPMHSPRGGPLTNISTTLLIRATSRSSRVTSRTRSGALWSKRSHFCKSPKRCPPSPVRAIGHCILALPRRARC